MLFESGSIVVTGIRRECQIKRCIDKLVSLLNSAGVSTDKNFWVALMDEPRIKTIMGVARLPFLCIPPEQIVTHWRFDSFARLQYNVEMQTYLTIRQVTHSLKSTSVNLFTRTGRMVVFGKDTSQMRHFVNKLSEAILSISYGMCSKGFSQ
jgi:hypothetical protein